MTTNALRDSIKLAKLNALFDRLHPKPMTAQDKTNAYQQQYLVQQASIAQSLEKIASKA